eukprot:TRINITY_DN70018_c0_g1_i1.p1 TRINITY_DN70018_c0_g1~~TRINITY_DN70018_c0_g1_i1.p1  ORF type:complete len:209 (-),score=22.30 TRINITY_DN70018_c0_g1_i1:24-614(-)
MAAVRCSQPVASVAGPKAAEVLLPASALQRRRPSAIDADVSTWGGEPAKSVSGCGGFGSPVGSPSPCGLNTAFLTLSPVSSVGTPLNCSLSYGLNTGFVASPTSMSALCASPLTSPGATALLPAGGCNSRRSSVFLLSPTASGGAHSPTGARSQPLTPSFGCGKQEMLPASRPSGHASRPLGCIALQLRRRTASGA